MHPQTPSHGDDSQGHTNPGAPGGELGAPQGAQGADQSWLLDDGPDPVLESLPHHEVQALPDELVDGPLTDEELATDPGEDLMQPEALAPDEYDAGETALPGASYVEPESKSRPYTRAILPGVAALLLSFGGIAVWSTLRGPNGGEEDSQVAQVTNDSAEGDRQRADVELARPVGGSQSSPTSGRMSQQADGSVVAIGGARTGAAPTVDSPREPGELSESAASGVSSSSETQGWSDAAGAEPQEWTDDVDDFADEAPVEIVVLAPHENTGDESLPLPADDWTPPVADAEIETDFLEEFVVDVAPIDAPQADDVEPPPLAPDAGLETAEFLTADATVEPTDDEGPATLDVADAAESMVEAHPSEAHAADAFADDVFADGAFGDDVFADGAYADEAFEDDTVASVAWDLSSDEVSAQIEITAPPTAADDVQPFEYADGLEPVADVTDEWSDGETGEWTDEWSDESNDEWSTDEWAGEAESDVAEITVTDDGEFPLAAASSEPAFSDEPAASEPSDDATHALPEVDPTSSIDAPDFKLQETEAHARLDSIFGSMEPLSASPDGQPDLSTSVEPELNVDRTPWIQKAPDTDHGHTGHTAGDPQSDTASDVARGARAEDDVALVPVGPEPGNTSDEAQAADAPFVGPAQSAPTADPIAAAEEAHEVEVEVRGSIAGEAPRNKHVGVLVRPDDDRLWTHKSVPKRKTDSKTMVLTPNVGPVRVIFDGGESIDGRLHAVGQNKIVLDTKMGRMTIDARRADRIDRLTSSTRSLRSPATTGSTSGLDRVRVRTKGGTFYGHLVSRDGGKVTLLLDEGFRITLESTDVVPMVGKKATGSRLRRIEK